MHRNRFALPTRPLRLAVLAVATAACSTMGPDPRLDEARREYRAAQANPQVTTLAPNELKQASDAIARAEAAAEGREMPKTVEHLAYLAKQQVALAEQTARLKAAEKEIEEAGAERERIRLGARTAEAERARAEAAAARAAAESTSKEAEAAKQQASVAQEEARRRAAETEAARAAAEREKATRSEQERARIEQQLKELNAQKSERGYVMTLGDVLFGAKKAQLGPQAGRGLDKLASFLQQHPERKVLVEGFTDSSGGAEANQALSEKRADTVRRYLVRKGVSSERIETKGYGEEFPVADNSSKAGRQANRRVEIVVSNENGEIVPR
jgi:outer membrane protein OmpA-like peptidoglycan-associated protein